MTVLEILSKLDESIEKERNMKRLCVELRESYYKEGDVEKALKQQIEVDMYTHSLANFIMLKIEIEHTLDEETSRAYEEMRASD